MKYNMVVIGTSTGGMTALQTIFACFPADFPLPVTIVIHRGKESAEHLTRLLQKNCHLPVKEIEDKMPIDSGKIFLAPPEYHVLVDQDNFSLSIDEPVHYARPSIDVLFESAAAIFTNKLVGIILTGAGQDGAEGLVEIKRRGGFTIVQEPASAECGILPKAAIDKGDVDKILRLEEIGDFLCQLSE